MSIASLALLAFAIFVAGLPLLQNTENAFILVALAAISCGLQYYVAHSEQDISQYGYLNPGFYLSLVPLGLSSEIPPWQRLGQAIIVLTIPCLLKIPMSGFTQGMLYMGVNLLRLVTAGGTYLGLNVALASVGSHQIWAILASLVVNYIFEAVFTNMVVEGAAEPADQAPWHNLMERAGRLLPAQVMLGMLTVALANGLQMEIKELKLAVAAAAALSSVLALVYHLTLWSSVDELRLQDQEALEVDFNKVRHNLKITTDSKVALEAELDKKSSELDLIYEMARSLGASTNLADTMQIVQSMIRRLRIPYQSCVIFLYKAGSAAATPGGGLSPALADTPYREVLEMSPLLQLQEPLITQVLHDQRPQINLEMTASAEQRIFKDERSVICVPLIVSKENVGVIYVGSVNPRTHKDEHLEKLKMLAAYAAPSIKTALLFENKEQDLRSERQTREAVEAKNRQLAGLQKLGQAIGSTLKIDNTLKVVADSLQTMLPQAQSFILFATDPEEEHALKAEFAHSPYGDYIRNLPMRNDEGLLGNATKAGTTLLVPDTQVYDMPTIINAERSVIVAPLTAESEVMGCLYVGAQKEHTFSEEHRSLVETVSYQAAIALKNARLYEQTQQMALTDGLTGLLTHRFFQTRLAEEIEFADRSGKPICLVMVDTDKFKQYNDTLGHPAGDSLLKDIAALLKDKVRSTDIVCRYGGDEFSLILRETPKDQAVLTCERIRETFQLRFAAHEVQVTASIGIACYPSDGTDKKDLLQATDEAMYFSKRNGRNRVTPSPDLAERLRRGKVEIQALPR